MYPVRTPNDSGLENLSCSYLVKGPSFGAALSYLLRRPSVVDTVPVVVKLVVHDFDGNLIDSERPVHKALLQLHAEMGLFEPPIEYTRSFLGPSTSSMARQLAVDGHLDESDVDAYVENFKRFYVGDGEFDGTIRETLLYPDIYEQLRQIQSAGVDQLLASTKPKLEVQFLVERLGLDHFFAGVEGPAYGELDEGKSATVARAIEKYRQHHNVDGVIDGVMVGDHRSDLDAAVANGLQGIGVAWGPGGGEDLRNPLHASDPVIVAHPEYLARVVLDALNLRRPALEL